MHVTVDCKNCKFRPQKDNLEKFPPIQTSLYDDRSRVRFTTVLKNSIDVMFRQFAFNLRKGAGILRRLPA